MQFVLGGIGLDLWLARARARLAESESISVKLLETVHELEKDNVLRVNTRFPSVLRDTQSGEVAALFVLWRRK